MLETLIDQLEQYAAHEDFLSVHARHALGTIKLRQSGELPKEAAVHNISTIIKVSAHQLPLEEFERKLRFNEVLNQIVSIFQAE
jgi:hypothetical protein